MSYEQYANYYAIISSNIRIVAEITRNCKKCSTQKYGIFNEIEF